MLQQTLQTNYQRFINFLGYSRGFILRNNPMKELGEWFVNTIKDFLTIRKKVKMAQYRLNYHKHQLHKMESLIAENNQHLFLKGKNINQVR